VDEIKEILKSAQTITVVGCSPDPARTSYAISKYLIGVGYTVIPVNPNCADIHGLTCYPDVQSIPSDVQLDIVNIFRKPAHTAEMVRNVLERIKSTGEEPVVWTQVGVSSSEAQRLAEESGLTYIRNRCIMVEHTHRAYDLER
jgi:predicted CoA-binding protein